MDVSQKGPLTTLRLVLCGAGGLLARLYDPSLYSPRYLCSFVMPYSGPDAQLPSIENGRPYFHVNRPPKSQDLHFLIWSGGKSKHAVSQNQCDVRKLFFEGSSQTLHARQQAASNQSQIH